MLSSTRIYLGSIIIWLCFIVFVLFSYLTRVGIHTLKVKFQFLDDHCYPRPSIPCMLAVTPLVSWRMARS